MESFRQIDTLKGPFQHEDRLGTQLAIEKTCHDAMSPLQRMEHVMNDWVIFGVMPIFALANAGVSLSLGTLAESFTHSVTQGVLAGLLLGKPLGIFFFSWLAVKVGISDLPNGVRWSQVLGVGFLGGIGFTMSLFITNLAFRQADLITDAKVGIFAASLVAGIIGYLLLARRPQSS